MSTAFTAYEPTTDDYWRSIVLFGRNVASYKFALAKSLLEMKPTSGQLIKLDELAVPFARHICEHLAGADKQGTSPSSRFLDACRKFNSGTLTQNELIDRTVESGFNNVINAFHIVGRDPVPISFFADERANLKGIRITDELSKLLETVQAPNLPNEAESRWRLVETAWELRMSRSLVSIDFDGESENLVTADHIRRRKPVTSSRSALNGYQKGKCFYCLSEISLTGPTLPDVDHFFPHALKTAGLGIIIDGV